MIEIKSLFNNIILEEANSWDLNLDYISIFKVNWWLPSISDT